MISNINNPEEPWIAINPNNTNQIVVGSNVASSGLAHYSSTNSGSIWTRGLLNSFPDTPFCDPCVVVDNEGSFYYSCIANRVLCNKILCFKSINGGVNWSAPVTFGQVNQRIVDMPSMCVDLSNSAYQNNIYGIWTCHRTQYFPDDTCDAYFSRSTDHGVSYSQPQKINSISTTGGYALIGCLCCTGPNGEIYSAWYNFDGIAFQKSTDGGVTWLSNDIMAVNSTMTMRFPLFCFLNNCISIACDISNSTNRGTIYISWADKRNINRSDVWIIKSTNSGNNWSSPERINSAPYASNKAAFYPKITIDQTNGNLFAVYYDDKLYSNYADLDVFVARSTNGGNTFNNARVNTNKAYLCTVSQWGFYGDYISIAAHNNKVRPVWMNGTPSLGLYTAIVDTFYNIGISKIGDKVPSSYKLLQNYPNPFNPATIIRFMIKESRFVTLKIYDILGKEIAKPVNEKLSAGEYETKFDGSELVSGVYIYQLTAGEFTDTKKMLLLK